MVCNTYRIKRSEAHWIAEIWYDIFVCAKTSQTLPSKTLTFPLHEKVNRCWMQKRLRCYIQKCKFNYFSGYIASVARTLLAKIKPFTNSLTGIECQAGAVLVLSIPYCKIWHGQKLYNLNVIPVDMISVAWLLFNCFNELLLEIRQQPFLRRF